MTCTTQILVVLLIGCAAREFSFNQSEAVHVISMEFLHSLLRRPFARALACSRRSDSGARAKNKASERAGERAGKKRGETRPLPQSPLVFFPLFRPLFRSLYFSLALFFARAPLSERLEQATRAQVATSRNGGCFLGLPICEHLRDVERFLPIA